MQQPLHELENKKQPLDEMNETRVQMKPSRQIIQNILSYSQALKINHLDKMGPTEQILN